MKRGSERSFLRWLAVGCAAALLAGCAQNREPVVPPEEAHLTNGLRNFKRYEPMNNNEIPNGPGIFSGSEGGFVIFRK